MASGQHTAWKDWIARALLGIVCGFFNGGRCNAFTGQEGFVIENAQGVRSLTYEQANQHLPVKLQGVVTYCHQLVAFIQDETGGVFFFPKGAQILPSGSIDDIKPGTLVQLEGLTIPGRYAPCVGFSVQLRVLGQSPMPEALHVPPSKPLQSIFDMQWVELKAVVVSTRIENESLSLDMISDGHRFAAVVSNDWQDNPMLERLTGSEIRIQGAYAGLANQRRQLVAMELMCPSMNHIEILDEGLQAAFAEPTVDVSKLLQYRPDRERRVKVQGTVLASFADHHFFFRSEQGAIEVQMADGLTLEPGHEIVAVGLPALQDKHVVLRDAVVRTTGKSSPPSPREFHWDDVSQGTIHGNLISISGVVVEHFHRLAEPVLVLQSGGRRFSVTVPYHPEVIAPNTHVIVSGICLMNMPAEPGARIVSDSPPPEPEWVDYAFTIKTRDANDVAILLRPSWWTRERLQAVGGLLGLGVVASTIWGVALRRKIREQTLVISEKIEKQRVSEERVRIASELHDSLEQQLVGIGLQLDNAVARLKTSPSLANQSITLARVMLRQSQTEARRTIWDLHFETRTREQIVNALEEITNNLQSDQGPTFCIKVADNLAALRGQIANHYLRVAQEAVTNAIKHAQASKVEISLIQDEEVLQLQVIDDGIGFNTQTHATIAEGHFGLSGMKQRASQLKGSLHIQSSPGEGTTLTLAAKIQ